MADPTVARPGAVVNRAGVTREKPGRDMARHQENGIPAWESHFRGVERGIGPDALKLGSLPRFWPRILAFAHMHGQTALTGCLDRIHYMAVGECDCLTIPYCGT